MRGTVAGDILDRIDDLSLSQSRLDIRDDRAHGANRVDEELWGCPTIEGHCSLVVIRARFGRGPVLVAHRRLAPMTSRVSLVE